MDAQARTRHLVSGIHFVIASLTSVSQRFENDSARTTIAAARKLWNRKIIIRTGISEREFDGGVQLLPGGGGGGDSLDEEGPAAVGGARRVAVRWGRSRRRRRRRRERERCCGAHGVVPPTTPRAGGLAPSGEDMGRACGWSPRKKGGSGSGSSVPYESRRLATGDVERPRRGRTAARGRTRGPGGRAGAGHARCTRPRPTAAAGSSVNGGGRWCTRVVVAEAEADPGEGSGGGGACAKTASGESERRAWSSSDCAWAAAGCTGGNDDGPRKEAPYGALGGRDAPSGVGECAMGRARRARMRTGQWLGGRLGAGTCAGSGTAAGSVRGAVGVGQGACIGHGAVG